MSQPLLTIAIPFTEERDAEFDLLYSELWRQIVFDNFEDSVELIWDNRGKEIPIGQKRNDLYAKAKGIFCVQWDSDDWIHENGVKLILGSLGVGVDAVGYKEHCMINGVEFLSNISNEYEDWEGEGSVILSDGFHYHRTLFFKTPIRTTLCQQVGVDKSIRYAEDIDFARRLKPHLENVGYIDEFIYKYIHNSKPEDFNSRYGIQ